MSALYLEAGWTAHPAIRALTTWRRHPDLPGHSQGDWAGLNLGEHVGDDPAAVAANRADLQRVAGLPEAPRWLNQVHGTAVAYLPSAEASTRADAAWTDQPDVVCAILTADCLPVFVADRQGRAVGLAHAGWRGLAEGVIEATLAAMDRPATELQAWLGPAIGLEAFQVGDEVRAAFLDRHAGDEPCFRADGPGHWRADLQRLARHRLQRAGVADVSAAAGCTFSQPQRFYSHRRSAPCGRMASLIWIEGSA
ncbi:peptidoglycan editing factor PgeF [Natronospira bacteriovora]|uniref:Purine nucleoside phosphorylase n=1 Tax=Natronospira bacteriovora TaxID=3069753 RepID=A0ABU0W939_9GAMM|nr:peptidoglycan editing factor PgeF [Natronospira sp. AB-CW4]MDQ2070424.1 peptidoglycan editing factor PgeF [Natronospira sp. AB-CW4]